MNRDEMDILSSKVTLVPLTFEHFRIQNLKRCEAVFHPISHWGLFDWSIAMIGEFGEAMNVVKKIRRIQNGTDPIDSIAKLYDDLAEEIADAVTYADLLLTSQGYRLDEELVKKFNKVSKKRGSDILL